VCMSPTWRPRSRRAWISPRRRSTTGGPGRSWRTSSPPPRDCPADASSLLSSAVSEASIDPTRDQLIAAAGAVFAEKGYDGAGVQEIARRAGYTTGAIYGRFKGKAELLLAAIEAHTNDELEQLFAEHHFEGRVTDIVT